MTNPKDIIGIVKELQANREAILADQWFRETNSTAFGKKLLEHFPAIAQSLIIAVEALEKSRRMADPYADPGIPTPEHAAFRKIFLDTSDALSRIRSLTS